ncbi:MAG TPA: TonB-dependent receptor [Candidatus Dormibacteraeota bacterium]|nr:TonB-dependent receptor [Candidatus Dormibacteraeota bacterium]
MQVVERRWIALGLFLCLVAGVASAGITGSISGVVTDPSGAVIEGASVVATDTQTGVKSNATTDNKGFFSLPALAVGNYNLEISQQGFKTHRVTGLTIDANSALRVDAALQLGTTVETLVVTSDAVHVETESTQMGEVITGKAMTAVPLNGRAYTDLLALQPGVSPYTAGDTGTPGVSDRAVDGGLNSGNQSVNGQRESANGFMVNGSNVEEGKNNGAAIIPNLDAISEFRIITNNFDSEYGNYSGGQINVVTKSGTNRIHGSGFEFLRNTSLDAKNYFAASTDKTPVFRQNQFGGTIGGPIKRDKTFFFIDYQAWRQTQAPTVNTQMPSPGNFTGDFTDSASSFSTGVDAAQNPIAAVVQGTTTPGGWANTLSTRLGYPVNDQEPYHYTAGMVNPATIDPSTGIGTPYATDCASNDPVTGCVFPTAIIAPSVWSKVATNMLNLGLIPQPNAANNFLQTSAYAQKLRDDKGGIRIDQNTGLGSLFAYYFVDDYLLNSPFPNGGASIPAANFAYNAETAGRAQLLNIGDTKNVGALAVNEFRFSYVRNTLSLGEPQGGVGSNYSLANLGFTTPWDANTGGISPIAPNLEGVPYITFNNFSIGVPQVSTRQYNNSFQVLDNFSRAMSRHSIKLGGQFHYDQINERNLAAENGQYGFSGNETGIDFADFLLGAPNGLTQASPQILDSRSKYYGLFAQDSWRATADLVLNYGLRWEASMPWYDTQNKTETIIPGQQSVVFPGAPAGWVLPGDPGVPRTLAPTQWHNFSPRVGLAYSPSASSGMLGKLLGGPGKTSIRIGGGLYYTSVEDLSQFLEVGDPPYGLYYGSAQPPLLESPYIVRSTGTSVGLRFPFPFPPTNVSAKNPDTTFPWAQVEPISFGFSFDHRNKLPYSEHYEFSIQRQIGTNTVVTASYVGNQGHRLVTSIEANPANQALCLFLSDPNNLGPNSAGPCGPFSETPPFDSTTGTSTPWVTASGQTIAAVRPLGPLFDTNPFESTIANSRYNSAQLSVSHTTGSLSFMAGYTFSKCMDNASGLQDSTNPYNPRLSVGLCNFDVTQSFVFNYNWLLPFDKFATSAWSRALIGGWSLSGITRFASGLPVSVSENDDNSLIGSNAVPVDVPNFAGGSVLADKNPRHGNAYFNPNLFTPELLGQLGNSRRRFFHGPGLNNFDMALLKNFKFTESKGLELRFEAFNVFNHAQFGNPDGEINSSQFGLVTSARDPRIMQVGAKVLF